MSVPLDQAELVEAIAQAVAQRVAQLLDERDARQTPAPTAPRLVSASELAGILGVERAWIYRHSDELGAVRLGSEHGRLRFDVDTAKAAMACSPSGMSQAERACTPAQPDPIRGRSARCLPNRLPPAGSVLPIRGKA